MKWYTKYLSVYEKPFHEAPASVIEEVKDKIGRLKDNSPLVSVIAIAHNEEKRILSCLWSLCDNLCDFPIEIMVINNNSTDRTEDVLSQLNVTYYNEKQKGPGYARQCGLNHAKGMYHICIDSDTLYPPRYIETMVKTLQRKDVACAYALWSFIPDKDHSPMGLFVYETFRDLYLKLLNRKRPELNVRGMVFAFKTELGRKEGFRKDIIRGEDGSLALALKKYGKLSFVTTRRARVMTGYGTIARDGTLTDAFIFRLKKAAKEFNKIFTSQEEYKDEDSNLIK